MIGDFNGWDRNAASAPAPRELGHLGGPGPGGPARARLQVLDHRRATGSGSRRPTRSRCAASCRPETGSVLVDLDYEWGDDAWMRGRGDRISLAAPVSIYEVHLGSCWRDHADRAGAPRYSELAPPADRARGVARVHPRRVPAGHGTPVLRLVGLPGHRLLRPDRPLRHPPGADGAHRPAAPGRHRGGARLGPVALRHRRVRPRALRRHPPLRARRPPPRHPPGLEQLRLQLRPPRGAQLPRLLGRALALRLPRRRAAGRRRGLDALPRLLAEGGGVDAERAGRARGPRRRQLPAAAQRRHLRRPSRRPGRSPRSRPRGRASRGRSSRAASGSASSGTWAGCTTRSATSPSDPVHRRYHHNELTFRALYAFDENFVLPLSHDEVVHGKGSLLAKMPGDAWQRWPTCGSCSATSWAQPGKKLLFMGGELATWREWDHERGLDWGLLRIHAHAGVARWVADLNRLYREHAGAARAGRRALGVRVGLVRRRRDEPARLPAPGLRGSVRPRGVQLHAGAAPQRPARGARGRPLGRAPEQRRPGVRRERRGQPRRGRGPAGPLARPAPALITITVPPLGCLFLSPE